MPTDNAVLEVLREMSTELRQLVRQAEHTNLRLDEQGELLRDQGTILGEQRELLREQGITLHDHSHTLREHGGILREQYDALREQSDILRGQSESLQESARTLRQHGEVFRLHDSRLQSIDQRVDLLQRQGTANGIALELLREGVAVFGPVVELGQLREHRLQSRVEACERRLEALEHDEPR